MPFGTDTQIFGPNGSEEEVTLPFSLYSGELRRPTLPLLMISKGVKLMNTQTMIVVYSPYIPKAGPIS